MSEATEPPDGAAQEGGLTRSERQLVQLATSQADDIYLATLIGRAQMGQPTPIALLTNGMIVIGVLTSSREMAAQLDAEAIRVFEQVDRPDDIPEEKWEKAREVSTDEFTGDWDKFRQSEDEFWDRLPDDDEPISAEDEEQLLAYQRKPFITIKDARIVAPGQLGATRVAVLRIPVRAVNGWWVPETQYKPDGSHQSGITFWEQTDERVGP
jgi:hypothetical protein